MSHKWTEFIWIYCTYCICHDGIVERDGICIVWEWRKGAGEARHSLLFCVFVWRQFIGWALCQDEPTRCTPEIQVADGHVKSASVKCMRIFSRMFHYYLPVLNCRVPCSICVFWTWKYCASEKEFVRFPFKKAAVISGLLLPYFSPQVIFIS